MRKLFVCAVAFAALTLTSCGNKQSGNAAPTDSIADTAAVVDNAEGEAVAGEMKAKLEAGDAEGFSTIVTEAKAKIDQLVKEGKVEEAKAYASKVKQFIDENAETIKQVTGGNETVSSIVSAIGAIPSSAEDAVNAAGEAVKSDAENAVNSAKEAAENKVNEAKDAAKQKANEEVDKAKQKANDAVDKAKQKANDEVNKAANKALNKLGL